MIRQLATAGALAAAACFGYGVLIESRSFRVRQVCLPVLPEGSDSIRILHISDFHLLARQATKLRFVEALAGLEPDLVVNTGDNIAQAEALEPLLSALGRLRDVPGVFVFGSNDYAAPKIKNPVGYLFGTTGSDGVHEDHESLPTEELRAGLTERGWHDAMGRRVTISVRGLNLEFRGTDDAHLELDDYAAVAGPAEEGTDLAIGVTHAPYLRVLDAMTDDGIGVILAGHTHGGQVCVPGWGALTTNCDLPPAQASGASPHKTAKGSSWLHVSAGLGTSPFAPYRFACPPEVTVLTLRPVSNG